MYLCVADAVYVLVAILKKELQLTQSLHSILQVLSVSTFEKVSLNQLLTTALSENCDTEDHNQLMLAWRTLIDNPARIEVRN
jgi:hypothetical protein